MVSCICFVLYCSVLTSSPLFLIDSSQRYNEDIIGIWTRTATDREVVDKVRDGIKKILQLPAHANMEYKAHQNSLQDKSSFRNTQVWKPKSLEGRNDNRSDSRSDSRSDNRAENRSSTQTRDYPSPGFLGRARSQAQEQGYGTLALNK
jgi:hypothetical protein